LTGVLLVGCGGGDDDSGDESADLPAGCTEVEAPPAKSGEAQPPGAPLDGPADAVVTTSCGAFTIQLDVQGSPKTAASFAGLAEQGFYDDTPIHRIARDFVIQGGDPAGDGTGGPGYSVVEAPPRDLVYEKYVVAMAKTGVEVPGTSGSQFFVVSAEDAQLPPDYALLGRVTAGEETIDRIAAATTDPATEMPVDPVVIESIAVDQE
jgi:cyclophilin family peptidyl-prolyl cis-trans isomerase